MARRLAALACCVLVVLAVGGGVPAAASAGQTVTSITAGSTPDALASKLLGSGISVVNTTYTGSTDAAGTFAGFAPAIGFDDGIVLSTGNAADVVGPNDSTATGMSLGVPGDTALEALIGGNTPTFDATILQLDFVPASDLVTFNYVFGSEEYNEFVGAGFDDVFAFTVNGVNCATVGGARVSVDSINNTMNAASYRDNELGGIDVELDGLTTVLTCEAAVRAGQTNSLRLAIADAGDDAFDSAVFLQARSLSAQQPPVCNDGAASTTAGVPVAITLPAADPNPTDILTWGIASPPANGTLSGAGPVVTYTPNAGFVGSDSFTYTADDGSAGCGPATVNLTVGVVPERIAVSSSTLVPGQPLTVSGAGFEPGTSVDVFLLSDPVYLGSAVANSLGEVTATVNIPDATPPGSHTILMVGTKAGGGVLELMVGVTVGSVAAADAALTSDLIADTVKTGAQAANTTTSGTLPPSGPRRGTLVLAVVGVALIAGGLLLRRRAQRMLPPT